MNEKDAHKMSNASLSRSTNTSINKEFNKSKKHIDKKAKNDSTKIIHSTPIAGKRTSDLMDESSIYLTKSEVDNIVKDSIQSAIETYNNKMTELMSEKIDAINKKVDEMEKKINKRTETLNRAIDIVENEKFILEQQQDVTKSKMDEIKEELDTCKNDLSNMSRLYHDTMTLANHNEQYSRRNNIRIFGIPQITPDEDCTKVVIDFVQHNLELDITSSDIIGAHRVGKKHKYKPQAIIVKFLRKSTKHRVISNRYKLKGKGLVIVEDLTMRNLQLLNRAQNHDRIKSAWTSNGKIFALGNNGIKVHLDLFCDIDALLYIANKGY